ncbi:hypothetical protein HXY33_03530 [Candidatus Bathyarchaeota archaeon]|nr:hypothetical protein [Candidatus Bathyarchaeota archaeon]
MENRKQSLKNEIYEMLYLVKTCITDFWFWLPILFMIFMYTQLIIFFYIHPLLLLVAPTLISLYALRQEKKRIKSKYNIEGGKVLSASDPAGTVPHSPDSKFNLEQAVEDYVGYLNRKKDKKDSS